MALIIALVCYMKNQTWLQRFLPKITNTLRFLCLVIPIIAVTQRNQDQILNSLNPRCHVRILIYRTWTFNIKLTEEHDSFSMFSTPVLIIALRELYSKLNPSYTRNTTLWYRIALGIPFEFHSKQKY